MSTTRPMNILVIEDEPAKRELIEQAIKELRPDASISSGRSVQQAVKRLREAEFDLIVLDMALPSHESKAGGAQPMSQPTGGVEVLLELSYEARADKVIIVTQYPDIEFDKQLYPLSKARQGLSKRLSVNIVDVIYFKARDTIWREQFRKALP
jgi:CheY-like chemotaxis protein